MNSDFINHISGVTGGVFPSLLLGICLPFAFLAAGRGISALARLKWRHALIRDYVLFTLGMDAFAFVCTLIFYTRSEILLNSIFIVVIILALPGIYFSGHAAFASSGHLFRRLAPSLMIVFLIAFPLLFCLGSALCPPVAWDELVYQFAVPVRWAHDHAATVYPDIPYSAFPSLPQFIYAIIFEFTGGTIALKLFNFFILCLVFAGVLLYGKIRSNLTVATIAVSALILSPVSLGAFARDSYSEVLIALNLVAALLFFCDMHGFAAKASFVPGILAGAAAAVKLTGGAVAAVILLFPLLKKRFSVFAVMLCFAAMFAMSFYIRPAVICSNPAYPYFASLFLGSQAENEMSAFHHAISSDKFGSEGVASFFTTPLMIGIPSFYKFFDGSYGFQFILFAAFFLWLIRENIIKKRFDGNAEFFLIAGVTFLYFSWYFTAQQARFLFPAAVMMFIASCRALCFLSPARRRLTLWVFLALAILSFPTKALSHYAICWKQVAGQIGRLDFIYSATGEGYLQAVQKLCDSPSGGKTLLVFEERTLYMPRGTVVATPFFQPRIFTPPDEMTTRKVIEEMDRAGASRMLMRTPENCPDMLPAYLERAVALTNAVGECVRTGLLAVSWSGPGGYVLLEKTHSNSASQK